MFYPKEKDKNNKVNQSPAMIGVKMNFRDDSVNILNTEETKQ